MSKKQLEQMKNELIAAYERYQEAIQNNENKSVLLSILDEEDGEIDTCIYSKLNSHHVEGFLKCIATWVGIDDYRGVAIDLGGVLTEFSLN